MGEPVREVCPSQPCVSRMVVAHSAGSLPLGRGPLHSWCPSTTALDHLEGAQTLGLSGATA